MFGRLSCVSSYASGKVKQYRVFGKHLALASSVSTSVIEFVNLVRGLLQINVTILELWMSSVDLYRNIYPSYYLCMAAFAHRLLYAFLSAISMKHAV